LVSGSRRTLAQPDTDRSVKPISHKKKKIIIIITGIIAKRISTHLEEQSLLPAEQKECHPGSKGCKDQLIISKTIYEDCRRRNKNLSIA